MSKLTKKFRCDKCGREQERAANAKKCIDDKCPGRLLVVASRQALLAKMKEIEAQKEVIAKDRDRMRELISEYEEIADSLDQGIESIETGLRYLQDGVDSMSQYV